MKTDKAVGCLLTVTNQGVNTANQVRVTVTASTGGTFLNSTSPLCVPNGSTLTCTIGQLSGVGTPNSIFTEKHELDMPASGASVTQTSTGAFSQKPNNRGSETIPPVTPVTTTQDDDADFDALFANSGTDTAQTDTNIDEDNPYTTGAELFGTFTVGLSVRERGAGENNPNCPTGCFGGQVIDFDIAPLPGTADPTSYTLVIAIADEAIPPGVKEDELDVRHDGVLVPLCSDADPAEEPCILDRDIPTGNPKDATILITGPGDQNGGWGVG